MKKRVTATANAYKRTEAEQAEEQANEQGVVVLGLTRDILKIASPHVLSLALLRLFEGAKLIHEVSTLRQTQTSSGVLAGRSAPILLHTNLVTFPVTPPWRATTPGGWLTYRINLPSEQTDTQTFDPMHWASSLNPPISAPQFVLCCGLGWALWI
eukprot:4706926-Pleurochrysis_carterae.AAC.1